MCSRSDVGKAKHDWKGKQAIRAIVTILLLYAILGRAMETAATLGKRPKPKAGPTRRSSERVSRRRLCTRSSWAAYNQRLYRVARTILTR